jgi:copper chaperone
MTAMKFKTNINCGGCIAAAKPYLDNLEGMESWDVDTNDPQKPLTIEGTVSQEQVVEAVQEAGYHIEPEKAGFFKRLFG